MVGMGRYRRSQDADEDFQVSMLHRSFSYLPDAAVEQGIKSIDNSSVAEFDPSIISKYQQQRRDSSATLHSDLAGVFAPGEYIDHKRSCPVVHGFEPVPQSRSLWKTSQQIRSTSQRKDVMAMSNDDGQKVHRRRKSRHHSMPISEGSSGSPLATISEAPDVVANPLRKIKQPWKLGGGPKSENALVSDDSDGESGWTTVPNSPAEIGGLSLMIQSVKESGVDINSMRQIQRHKVLRPAQRPAQRVQETGLDRSNSVRRAMQPIPPRAKPDQNLWLLTTVPTPADDNEFLLSRHFEEIDEKARAKKKKKAAEKSNGVLQVQDSSDEDGEDVIDLSTSVAIQKAKFLGSYQDEGDTSTKSTSSVKTVIGTSRKVTAIYDPIQQPRKRSETVVRFQEPELVVTAPSPEAGAVDTRQEEKPVPT